MKLPTLSQYQSLYVKCRQTSGICPSSGTYWTSDAPVTIYESNGPYPHGTTFNFANNTYCKPVSGTYCTTVGSDYGANGVFCVDKNYE